MKIYLFLLFVVIVGFAVSDLQKEHVVVEWVETHGKLEGNAKVFFENVNFQEETIELPLYTRLYNLNSDSKTLRLIVENPVYQEIDSDSLPTFSSEVPNELQVRTQVLKSRNNKNVELQIVPIKKENNRFYRLVSFDLKQIPDVIKSAQKAEFSWKESSVLKQGKWVKIAVSAKGIYKIPYTKLSEWGFSEPDKVGVYGSGGTILDENPGVINYSDVEECAVWSNENNGEECLFFYAPGIAKWTLQNNTYSHQLNDYTQTGYFYLGETSTSRKEVTKIDELNEAADFIATSFDAYDFIENEELNILPSGSGKQWFGQRFLNGSDKSYNFTIADLDESEPVKVVVQAAARSYSTSSMTIFAGETVIGNIAFSKINTTDSYGLYASLKNEEFEISAGNGPLQIGMNYNAANNTAEAWADYVELHYRRKLRASNDALFFRDSQSVGEGNSVEFQIEGANSSSKVFNVSDVNNVSELTVTLDGTLLKTKQSASELSEYVLFNPEGTFEQPTWVDDVENQNLHALNTPEFLIISHSAFMSSAVELADFHREYDGMDVEVVNVDKVYNEFSSGSKSATGIRNFIKMFYDRGSTLKYVLLFGNGSYDNKGVLPDTKSFIPTFQSDESLQPIYSFVSDDYFVMLDADESVYNGAIDLGIGRMPVSTAYEAELVVDKIERYYEPAALGDWRNVLCFIGDDGDGGLHMRQSEILTDTINKNYPEFLSDKIYFDAYPKTTTPAGDRYPDVNAAINERVKEGVLVLNYTGHANDRFLADEHVLDITDINSWSNKNKLPIFVTATCEFSRFDTDETSAGEYVLLNPNGGGIGLFSTTRVVFASANFKLNRSFYSFIFEQNENGEHYRMGDVMRLAKTNISSSTNKRNFTLLADPALKLSYPKYRVVTNSINQTDATQLNDTIGALQKITVSGHVSDYFGNIKTDFNGEIIPTVYDKSMEVETLGNGGQQPVTFSVQENIIYKGRASVKAGEFSFTFVVPKDISYNLGQGKIVYYTENGQTDAHGAFDNFYIGGSDSEISDNKGPEIQLYLDTEAFSSGDKTGKNPTLLAYLSDENGINTVGTGIGHDITAVLDNDYSNVFVLNNYYQAETDDYTSGSLQYPFSDLTPGLHTLSLKAWDVANNSSEVEIEFEVSGEFIIQEISNYPNPVSTYTNFVLKHNQSDGNLNVIFDIFDSAGQRIDQFQTEVSSAGNATNPIRWNLNEAGVNAGSGIYVYRAIVQNSDGIITSKTGKMLIVK